MSKGNLREYGKYLQFGIQLALTMVVPVLVGFWLDDRLGTFPWLLITGVVFGMLSAGWTIYKLVYELELEDKKRKARKNDHKSDS